MIEIPKRGLFITGTGTSVGKTFVTVLIALASRAAGHRTGIYKPVASGCDWIDGRLVSDDAAQLRAALDHEVDLADICPQSFQAPLAPHLSAAAEGKQVDRELLRSGLTRWQDRCDVVLVEGAGGLMSPLSPQDYVADLAAEFGYPVVVVALNRLGVINQTLQTLITASNFRDGLDIAGVVLNDRRSPDAAADPSVESNRRELEVHCMPPILAHVAWQATRFDTTVDWFQLAERP